MAPKPPLKYWELQQQLLADAKLLLDIANQIATENPNQPVPPERIEALQQQYNDHPDKREPYEPMITRTGRARVSC